MKENPFRPETQAVYPSEGFEFHFFGTFSFSYEGRKIELPNKARALLAYMFNFSPRAFSRDHLARVFWPDKYESSPESARQSLNVEINRIRNAIERAGVAGRDFILHNNQSYGLQFKAPVCSDVKSFSRLCKKINEEFINGKPVNEEDFQKLISLYKDLYLNDLCSIQHPWIEMERRRFGGLFEQMIELYGMEFRKKLEYRREIALYSEILGFDCRMESIHYRLIEAYIIQGMYAMAQTQYKIYCRMMETEFQSGPSPEVQRLLKRMISGRDNSDYLN